MRERENATRRKCKGGKCEKKVIVSKGMFRPIKEGCEVL